ncbi:hypothetical protein F2P81_015433 [Scophthalmus maximus]|uniref:C2H2-type domain-containing protein n=1 Tax=Scophthalmus maximus TaxID=52904 RepID=A0A6A4SG75_SCOMX|nr:hypothetical protein F2P81_015433 [Scophthalmus maximus]
MNGAVYISFFQGQLESVLEQVVQLAVQEISRTVGCSLNALLLETAAKEQENRRLRLQLQRPAAEGGGTEPELPRTHAPGGQRAEPRCPTDTRRLEQRGRVVDQLKSVMEQVLNFAVRELTKIVEASFDDLLLEITKMDREQQLLEEDDEGAGTKESRATLANDGANDCQDGVEPPGRTCPSSLTTREEEEEEEEEEYEEEDKGRKKKRRRVWSECDECGRRFSRMSLLKAHRQTHVDASSPPDGAASALRCSDCGKRFSSATRLHSHIRTQHPGNRA